MEEEGDCAVIRVGSGTNEFGVPVCHAGAKRLRLHPGVMQQPEGVIRGGAIFIEPSFFQAQPHRDGTHDLDMHLVPSLEECLHEFLELGARGVEFVGPEVGILGLVGATDLKGFFEFRGGVTQGVDGRFARETGQPFAAEGAVPAVCARAVPCQSLLLYLGPVEEFFGLRGRGFK